MTRRLAPAALAAALAGCAAGPPAPDNGPAELAAAESAFAAQSVREGMKAAFLAWFAPGSVLLRGGPVDARDLVGRNPDPPIVLDWRPAFVALSASGDLGFSTGPTKIASRTDAARPPRYGQYFSVWRREAGGPWRVWVDLGINHASPALWDAPLAATRVAAAAGDGLSLAEAEARFARLSKAEGQAAAYRAWSSPEVRVYREGLEPMLDPGALLASTAIAGRATWTADRTEASAANDLGFTLGRYERAGERGHFVRVWRKEAQGWRILGDITEAAKAN